MTTFMRLYYHSIHPDSWGYTRASVLIKGVVNHWSVMKLHLEQHHRVNSVSGELNLTLASSDTPENVCFLQCSSNGSCFCPSIGLV